MINNDYIIFIYWVGCIIALLGVLIEITRLIDNGDYKEENINDYVFALSVFPLFSWILVIVFLLILLFRGIRGMDQ